MSSGQNISTQKTKNPQDRFVDSFAFTYIASIIAATSAELITYPLDLTKTRLQIQGEVAVAIPKSETAAPQVTLTHYTVGYCLYVEISNATCTIIDLPIIGQLKHRGMLATAVGIAKEEGPTQLWRGLSSVICRHVIYSGVRTTLYDYLRKEYGESNNHLPVWKAALCGALAGSIAQWLATPADLVKIQIQMEGHRRLKGEPPRIRNISQAFVDIYQRGGIAGLWKGSVPSVQRAALVTLGDVTGYDISKRTILNEFNMMDGPIVHFMASICAAVIATVLSTPADVIKSRVMNQPTDESGRGLLYKGSYDCLRKAIKHEGYFALYKGFLPTLIRLGPWSLIFWLTFEQVRSLVGVGGF